MFATLTDWHETQVFSLNPSSSHSPKANKNLTVPLVNDLHSLSPARNGHVHRNPYSHPAEPPAAARHFPLVILVFSAPSQQKRRQLLRETWLNASSAEVSISVQFMVCGGVKEETSLQAEFLQPKRGNLQFLPMPPPEGGTESCFQSALVWISEHLLFDHVLIVNDNDWVQSSALLKVLPLLPSRMSWIAHFACNTLKPPQGNYLADRLPCVGKGSILSRDVIYWMAENAKFLQMHGDYAATLGIWLSTSRVKRREDKRILVEGCKDDALLRLGLEEASFRTYHQNKQLCDKLCSCP